MQMYRLTRVLSFWFWIVAMAVLGYHASALIPAAYVTYALVAAGVMAVCGIVMIFSTYRTFRGGMFGFGAGVLVGLYPALVALVQSL